RIGGAWLSAEEETEAILSGLARGSGASEPGPASVHEHLRLWLKTQQPVAEATAVWRGAWTTAESFSALKKPWLLGFLGEMEEHGMLGEAVLDVGAGCDAVSN